MVALSARIALPHAPMRPGAPLFATGRRITHWSRVGLGAACFIGGYAVFAKGRDLSHQKRKRAPMAPS